MSFKIEEINCKDEWDNLVTKCEYASIFHTWDWLKIIEKYSNFKLQTYAIIHGKTPIGVLPIYSIKKLSLEFMFSPPPRFGVPFLGFIFCEFKNLKQNKKELYISGTANLIDELIKEKSIKEFRMTLPPNFVDIRSFIWNSYSVSPTYNYIFDLRKGKEEIWNSFKKELRKNIKRASQVLTVELGGEKELDQIYDQTKKRYREQGRKFKLDKNYLFELYNKFNKNFQILVAKADDEIVGGMVNLTYSNKIYSWLGNTKTNLKGIYPNDLLIWKSIEIACNEGFSYFYEIGANTPRIVNYKSNFNPDLVLNFTIVKKTIFGSIAERIYRKIKI